MSRASGRALTPLRASARRSEGPWTDLRKDLVKPNRCVVHLKQLQEAPESDSSEVVSAAAPAAKAGRTPTGSG